MENSQQKILAIETSGKTLSVALLEQSENRLRTAGELYINAGMRQSEMLKPSCEFLLRQVGWELQNLTSLAVANGPGSFTGLRIGISFARALAQTLHLPLAGISTFEVLAAGASSFNPPVLAVLLESIGRDVFAGFFQKGSLRPFRPYKVTALPELFKEWNRYKKVAVIGDGFLRHEAEIRKNLKGRLIPLPAELHFPRAARLATLAAAGKKARMKGSWKKVTPFYLRPPIAVERLQRKP